MKSRTLFCALSITVWLAVTVYLWPSHGLLLNWDEVDYVSAAGLGLRANALDKGSLSPFEFAGFALAKITRETPTLPAYYDESRDPFVLRHYHPPFVVFLLSQVAGSRSERVFRSVQLAGALALAMTLFFSYRSISPEAGWCGIFLLSVLSFWILVLLFGSLSFHGWAAVWTTTTAALLGQWLTLRRNALGFFLCLNLALTFVTLETGPLVGLGVIFCLLIWRVGDSRQRKTSPLWRHLFFGSALVVLFVVVLWPGSVFKASIFKNPAFHLYRMWLGHEYGEAVGYLAPALRSLLPLLILGPLASAWLFINHREGIRLWGPLVLIGALYTLVMARFAHRPEYLLPGLAPFACIAALAADRLSSVRARLLMVAVAIFTVVLTWPGRSTAGSDGRAREDLHWLGTALNGREALIDGGHIYQYYLGGDYSIRSITVSYNGDGLLVRERGAYRALSRRDLNGSVVVIQGDRGRFFGGRAAKDLFEGCARIERPTVRIYDCK